MSDQQMPMASGAPMAAPSLDEVLASLLHATNTMARLATGASDARDPKDYGGAALSFANAYAVLHPGIVAPQGVTPEQIAASVPTPPPAEENEGAADA